MRRLFLLLLSAHFLMAEASSNCFEQEPSEGGLKVALLWWKLQSNWWGNNYLVASDANALNRTVLLYDFNPSFSGGLRLEYNNTLGANPVYVRWTRFVSKTGVDATPELPPVGAIVMNSDFLRIGVTGARVQWKRDSRGI